MNSSQVDLLEIAGNMLERHDTKDQLTPGFLELTGIQQHGMATSSGLLDYDYQNLSSLTLGQKQLIQMHTVSKIPIPSEILEHFKHIKCHCMMGLFPEIGRAWLTIDSEIFIWTYENERDVAYYDGLNHLIVSVGLIKPKSNVFIPDVKYMLVLTTPIEIVVLGVTFGDATKTISSPTRNMQNTTTFKELQLMTKPIFVLTTDNVAIDIVQGSEDGRIFLGARDGCLYEISYQAESSWFGKRCKKINHSQSIVSYIVPNFLKVFSENDPIVQIKIDNSRQFLYLLTSKGCIEAWVLGNDSNTTRRIARITGNEMAESAFRIVTTVDKTVFTTVKAICTFSNEDSANMHLLAVTQSGARLYFAMAALKLGQKIVQPPQQIKTQKLGENMSITNVSHVATTPIQPEPQGFYLLHVRLPPGYTPNSTFNKPKLVHSAFYSDETMLLISTPQQDQVLLWSISSAPFPNRTYLSESTTVLPLDGIVWDVAEVNDVKSPSFLRKAQKPTKVVLLTNQGAHLIALLKPMDILVQLLIACQGPQHDAVKAFFKAQTEREACATSLLIACAEVYRGTDLAMWAAQAFMLYGGEPYYPNQMLVNTPNIPATQGQHIKYTSPITMNVAPDRNTNNMYMSTPMSNVGGTPIFRSMQTSPQGSIQHPHHTLSPVTNNRNSYGQGPNSALANDINVIFSAKHDGLYSYVSRLLRPIWMKRCLNSNLTSALTPSEFTIVLEDLYALKVFLDANSVNEFSCKEGPVSSFNNQTAINHDFSQLLQKGSMTMPEQPNVVEQAQSEEKRSLTALNSLIKHACEVVALWKILCEHNIQELANRLSTEQQAILLSCNFKELILFRNELCAHLIVGLINSYLEDNASVSSISKTLRDVCPNLYRHEDAISYKAAEMLMTSKICLAPAEKDEKLRTALTLCKDAAPNIPLSNICQQFTLSGFYEGVIELSATCAAKADPEEFGIHYYKSDEPSEDSEGYAAFATRMSFYKEITVMLDQVYQNITSTNTNQEYRGNINANSCFQPNNQIMEIIEMGMRFTDPLLHISIYEWLLAQDMLTELLALVEPTLGEFLRRNVIRNPDNLKLIDLLWKYYEKNGHHSQAARILDNLAMTKTDSITLEQRIEYLARAVMCMRNESGGYTVSNGVLLKELEDKLEIARVQKSVLDAMTIWTPSNSNAIKAINDLNYTLYDITQLYQNFANPFDLWECKLIILNCSNHNDPLLIETVWGQILNKALEGPESVNQKCLRLFAKVESLVKEFGESGHCFPLAFLIRELEVKACQLNLSAGFVAEKLVSMNLDIELLMEYYTRMISMNERIWSNEGNEWHLVQSSITLITLLANNVTKINSRLNRRIVGKAQDIISVCLNLCYQKPGTEDLQRKLKELQCRLQRCIS